MKRGARSDSWAQCAVLEEAAAVAHRLGLVQRGDSVGPVFVLLLTYVKPLAEVDALMRRHVAWLNEHYDAGRFLVSGRRIPRTGGVIVARGNDREEIEAVAASDPFVTGGVATCEVIQFRASQTAAGLDQLA
jgi:uncharacterized protein YciI